MVEFKGSRGKWKKIFAEKNCRAIRNDGGIIIRFWKPNHYDGQEERYERELKETQANQQLCFKAPEMLEMLKKVTIHFSSSTNEIQESLMNEVKQLIKEATTI